MQLRWTEEAATDLERIADYLFEHVPERAPALVRAIYDAPCTLLTFPHQGRPGKNEGPAGLSAARAAAHAARHARAAAGEIEMSAHL